LAAVVLPHWDDLVSPYALPDSFSLAVLWRLRDHDVASIVALVAAVLLGAFALVPRRWIAVLPALVLAVLVVTSVAAEREIGWRVRFDQTNAVGSPRDWMNRATHGRPAAYLYAGEDYANGVWQALLWNPGIHT